MVGVRSRRRLGLAAEGRHRRSPCGCCSQWHGLWLPKGTPKNIIAKVNGAVMDVLADPKVRARLADLGQEIFPHDRQTPEALGAFQKAEIEKWWPIIKAANIKGE